MMPRIYLLLVAGMLPLSAQTSVYNGGQIRPDKPPTIQPAGEPGAETLHPAIAPQPNDRPGAPIVHPRLTEFTVSPSICREGITDKANLKTTIKLNVPALRQMIFHITSSDVAKVKCTDVILIRNSQEGIGGIGIDWKAVGHNCQVDFKAYCEDEPELIFTGRIYLKKKLE